MFKLKSFPICLINLQLFSEGGDGGTGTEGAKGVTEGDANLQTQITDSDGTTATTIDRKAEFEKLIKGEYKEEYGAKVEDTVQKRLKSTKGKADKYDSIFPMLETLGKKYGVDFNDAEALIKAIDEDDSFYEQEALEKGITVEALKEIKKMERENSVLKKQMEELNAKENADRQVASWMQEAETVKAIYPTFDLGVELQNERFIDLLNVPGVDVRTAFELTHKDDIIAGAMHYTAKEVEKKMSNKVMANGSRPAENGMNSQAASLTKSDVSQLSKDEILDIQRRVARGERIDFTR